MILGAPHDAYDLRAIERLMDKVQPEPNTGCWLWDATLSSNGYGMMGYRGRVRQAHRISYTLFVGPIPTDLDDYFGWCVCHRCDTPACVNPEHLFVGSHQDNMADMAVKGRAAPPRGERSTRGKLTTAAVLEIRERAASGELQARLAREFAVSAQAICKIVNRQSWKHV